MSSESIAAFTAYMQEQSDEIANQLNDFIGELILKIAPNNPIVTDGYQITFDFGNGFTEKPAKAKILISVVVKKPGVNTLPVLQNNNIPPYIKLIRLGPITYTVCDVPIYWKKDSSPLKEIYVNPVSNTFDVSLVKPLIDLAITELSRIYASMRR